MIRAEHELHRRRRGRNFGVGALLLGFAAIVFGLSVVKITNLGPTEGFDHVARPQLEMRADDPDAGNGG
ncbi:hypothetical protein RM543_06780 [Roseicyclus sp. F158]|uniref:Cytochrome C oxidase assembly protein n=1 Tax=Tropicimonas omnivorans TaxID=3075590 RepID=A0ABU3DFC4_9RHOB|nr:hypothetical protein [Roseicyclus sp. F158]MDT0682382.1 hypothetical protein [Roseicyclus sp. F158]